MEERAKIDVYSDKFKTINVIDFEKLKKEALRLKEISDKYKKNKKRNTLDIIINYIGLISIIILGTLGIIIADNFDKTIVLGMTLQSIFIYLIFIMLPYNFIKTIIKTTITENKRKKFFPQDTPQEIVNDVKSKLSAKDIEKIIYINKVLILPGILPNHIEYKILDTIESEEKDNFLLKAYEIKANVIINYQSHKYTKSTVEGVGLAKGTIKHKTGTDIIGIAVQAINENKNSNASILNNQAINP